MKAENSPKAQSYYLVNRPAGAARTVEEAARSWVYSPTFEQAHGFCHGVRLRFAVGYFYSPD